MSDNPNNEGERPMTTRYGWKLVNPDGRTSHDFRWPLVAGAVVNDVDPAQPLTSHDSECPLHPGDGLCVGLTPQACQSGGVRSSTILLVTWDDKDTAAERSGKVRVRGPVTVVEVYDWWRLLREGAWRLLGDRADLAGADLAGADLYGADLYGADLRGADLRGANLYCADLYGADLAGADLYGADLYDANLYGWERGPDGYARKVSAT